MNENSWFLILNHLELRLCQTMQLAACNLGGGGGGGCNWIDSRMGYAILALDFVPKDLRRVLTVVPAGVAKLL